MDRRVARPLRPVGLHADAEVVLRADPGVRDGLPEPLRRRLDVDLVDLLHRPHSCSRSCLSRLRPAAIGSAYLLTQRSWMSRIGTALRKCSFSRPRFFVVIRPASSSTLRCFMTPN